MAENRGRMKSVQKDRFVTLMADMVMNRPLADMTAKEQKSMWSRITQELNELGPQKTQEQWKRCWTDIKSTVKDKVAKRKDKKVTKIDMKVVAIMNKERQNGNFELHDIGLRSVTQFSPRATSSRSPARNSTLQSNSDRRSMERASVTLSLIKAYGLNQPSDGRDLNRFDDSGVHQTIYETPVGERASITSQHDNSNSRPNRDRVVTVTSSLPDIPSPPLTMTYVTSRYGNYEVSSEQFREDRIVNTDSVHESSSYRNEPETSEYNGLRSLRNDYMSSSPSEMDYDSEYENISSANNSDGEDIIRGRIGGATGHESGLRGEGSGVGRATINESFNITDRDGEDSMFIGSGLQGHGRSARKKGNGQVADGRGHGSGGQGQRGGVRGHGNGLGRALNDSPTIIDSGEDSVSEVPVKSSVRGRGNIRGRVVRRVPSNESIFVYNSDRENSLLEEPIRGRGRGRGRARGKVSREQFQQRRPSTPLTGLADNSVKLQEEGTEILHELKRQNDVIIKQNQELIEYQRSIALDNRDILNILRDHV